MTDARAGRYRSIAASMLNVTLMERGGESQRLQFDKTEITIGRVQGNDIVLPKGNVSKRHCRIAAKDGRILVMDLQSTNGTYVNGRKVTAPQPVRASDRIYLGDFVLQVAREREADSQDSAPRTLDLGSATQPPQRQTQPHRTVRVDDAAEVRSDEMDVATPAVERSPDGAVWPRETATPEVARATLVGARTARSTLVGASSPEDEPTPPGEPSALRATIIAPGGAPGAVAPAPEDRRSTAPMATAQAPRRPTTPLRQVEPRPPSGPMATLAALRALQREVHDRVVDSADMRLIESERLGEAALRARAEQAIAAVIRDMTTQGRIPNSMDRLILGRNVLRELVGLGPLEELLSDEDIGEILIDSADRIQVVRGGQRERRQEIFSSERAAQSVIDRLLRSAGARPEDGPLLDLRMPDGARLCAVLPPLAMRGPALAIRKRKSQPRTLEQLVAQGALSSAMADLLWAASVARRNLLVCGGAGSGKTTLLSAIAAFLPEEERVICVEDTEEIRPGHDLWLQLECAAGPDGQMSSPRELLRSALRLRPDRLVVGDIRGIEALDLLQAMASGLEGTLAALHAASPQDGLSRLERWARAEGGMEPRSARELVAAAIHLVVYTGRFPDGVRRVTQISEVRGAQDTGIELRDVFVFTSDGREAAAGRFAPTGVVPVFISEPGPSGLLLDEAIFRE